MPGPLSLTAMRDSLRRGSIVRLDHDARRRRRAGAGLDRVAQQVAERLPQQHLVAFDGAELAAHLDVAAERARVGPDLLGRALADARADRRRVSVSCAGRAKFRKLVTTCAERLGLGANAFDVRPVGVGQRVEIEQLAVAVNRRQPVAELVRDAGGQLADRRQAVLQPQLLFEILDRRQIGEQADRAVQLAVARRTAATRSRRDA